MFAIAELIVHPMTSAGPASRVTVELDWPRNRSGVSLNYRVRGDVPRLRLPEPAGRLRSDGLWQHTCFEIFLRPEVCDGYFEFNFSPSGAWAAYRFAARRSGMRPLEGIAAPSIDCRVDARGLELSVNLDIGVACGLDHSRGADIGLSAVLEDDAGRRSCWALGHRSPEPDFHDPDTFSLRAVPAPGHPELPR